MCAVLQGWKRGSWYKAFRPDLRYGETRCVTLNGKVTASYGKVTTRQRQTSKTFALRMALFTLPWSDCQDENIRILFLNVWLYSFISISKDLNAFVPSVQTRRLFWRADSHPASAEKNQQNLPGSRNAYIWVSRMQSTQERNMYLYISVYVWNMSKLDWSRIKIIKINQDMYKYCIWLQLETCWVVRSSKSTAMLP